MDNKKFIQLIRAVIREEVKTAVKEVLLEQKQTQTKQISKPSLKEMVEDPFEKANRILQQSRKDEPVQNKRLSKNPILNEVLNQTMPFQPGMSRDDGGFGTMNFTADMIGYGGMNTGLPTTNPDGQPLAVNPANKEVAAVAKAMTRDYSELVKRFKK
jgi:hypothetical protein